MVFKIEVEGSHYEMGLQQGIQVKDIWVRMYNEALKSDLVAGAKPKVGPAGFLMKLLGWISKKKHEVLSLHYIQSLKIEF